MEALYQAVYAQAFAIKWSNLVNFETAARTTLAQNEAETAAAFAVESFSFAQQHAVLVAKGQEP